MNFSIELYYDVFEIDFNITYILPRNSAMAHCALQLQRSGKQCTPLRAALHK